MKIDGLRLHRNATHTIVSIEAHGCWIEVCREPICGAYDHIVNESGLRRAVSEAADQLAIADLVASGGIVDG